MKGWGHKANPLDVNAREGALHICNKNPSKITGSKSTWITTGSNKMCNKEATMIYHLEWLAYWGIYISTGTIANLEERPQFWPTYS